MNIMLKNELGVLREVKVGFSWTTFFFGVLPTLIRGEIKWFLIMTVTAFATFGLSNIFFAFVINKIYIKKLLSEGYKAVTEEGHDLLVLKGFLVEEQEEEQEEELELED